MAGVNERIGRSSDNPEIDFSSWKYPFGYFANKLKAKPRRVLARDRSDPRPPSVFFLSRLVFNFVATVGRGREEKHESRDNCTRSLL